MILCFVDLIDFFLEPYKEAPVLNIVLEFVAALFGVAGVLFAKKENILVFPTGIVSTGIYVYLLSQWSLYGDLIINIYYTIMSIYGWYMWSRTLDDNTRYLAISNTDFKEKIKTFGIFLFTSAFVIGVYRYYNVMPNNLGFIESVSYALDKLSSGNPDEFRAATPYLDTFTTGAAFSGMWLMANKKIENWILWIVVNSFSIPLYIIKGYGFTAIQYTVFLVLAIYGYKSWKKLLKSSVAEQQA